MATAKTTQSFELSSEDAGTAIAEFIEKRFGVAGKITVGISVATITTGYGPNEQDIQTVKITATREP